METNSQSNRGFLARAHSFLIYLGVIYISGVLLLLIPTVQTHFLYLHKVQVPAFPKFDSPQIYGLAPYKTLDINLSTGDNVRLGAWFVLSDSFFQHASQYQRPTRPFSEADISQSILERPTILFFHGNAGSRAAPYRVTFYSTITSRLDANVLAIDYRGFGNSEGVPSELGLGKDSRAAWDWLISHGATPQSILIVGHSLGTGVGTMLATELAHEGIHPRGLTLVAPFTSIKMLAKTYTLLGGLPLLRPITTFPFAFDFVLSFLNHKFDTISRIPAVRAPILLIHSEADDTIPYSHSRLLFDALLEPLLPPFPFTQSQILNPTPGDSTYWKQLQESTKARSAVRAEIVREKTLEDFAFTAQFQRSGDGGKVKHVEMKWGGHTKLVTSEGLVDLIGDFFNLTRF